MLLLLLKPDRTLFELQEHFSLTAAKINLSPRPPPPNKPEAQTAFSVCAPGFVYWEEKVWYSLTSNGFDGANPAWQVESPCPRFFSRTAVLREGRKRAAYSIHGSITTFMLSRVIPAFTASSACFHGKWWRNKTLPREGILVAQHHFHHGFVFIVRVIRHADDTQVARIKINGHGILSLLSPVLPVNHLYILYFITESKCKVKKSQMRNFVTF